MPDSMPYDPIQGQGQAVCEVPNFSNYLLRHLQWQLANDQLFLNYSTMSKFVGGRIFDICPSFCVT